VSWKAADKTLERIVPPGGLCGTFVFHGELVNKVTAHTLFFLLVVGGLAFLGPGVAHASTNSAQTTAQREAKKSQKTYRKQQQKEQKKAQKAQKQAMRNWKRQHPTAH
jgi:hypothetical protein